MDFAFSDEQEMLRAAAREWLADAVPLGRVAELAESDAGWDPSSWGRLRQLGWLDDELGLLDLAVLAEEAGYALYPGPWWSTVGLARPVLAAGAGGRPGAGAGSGPGVGAGGDRPTALAWADAEATTLREAARSTACRAEAGPSSPAEAARAWRLTGSKLRVPDGAAAERLLVVATSADGVGIFAVDSAAGSGAVTVTPVPTTDTTRRYATVTLDAAPAEAVVAPGSAPPVLAAARARALALLACEAVGVLQRALDLAVAYAKDRTQFGRPIGSFQAVSHRLADTYADLQLARSLAYRAVWAVDADDESAGEAVASALVSAGGAATTGCERAIQAMGGIGFTWDHPLHRLYKRAQWVAAFEGGARAHRDDLAALLLDTPVPVPPPTPVSTPVPA